MRHTCTKYRLAMFVAKCWSLRLGRETARSHIQRKCCNTEIWGNMIHTPPMEQFHSPLLRQPPLTGNADLKLGLPMYRETHWQSFSFGSQRSRLQNSCSGCRAAMRFHSSKKLVFSASNFLAKVASRVSTVMFFSFLQRMEDNTRSFRLKGFVLRLTVIAEREEGFDC